MLRPKRYRYLANASEPTKKHARRDKASRKRRDMMLTLELLGTKPTHHGSSAHRCPPSKRAHGDACVAHRQRYRAADPRHFFACSSTCSALRLSPSWVRQALVPAQEDLVARGCSAVLCGDLIHGERVRCRFVQHHSTYTIGIMRGWNAFST